MHKLSTMIRDSVEEATAGQQTEPADQPQPADQRRAADQLEPADQCEAADQAGARATTILVLAGSGGAGKTFLGNQLAQTPSTRVF